MRYKKAKELLNRRSVKLAIKFSDLARGIRGELFSEKNNRKSCVERNFLYEPFSDPVRTWSNLELKKLAPLFNGDIVNVSGWEDKDKDGGYYKDYFVNATSYFITNFSQHMPDKANEIELDLEKDLPSDLVENFDVVFNHTILEHIFEVKKAYRNMAAMTKDIIITIVPFIQQQHEHETFKDYWRFTPLALKRLANENNMEVIYENYRREPHEITYVISVASKNPKYWKGKMPEYEELSEICKWVG